MAEKGNGAQISESDSYKLYLQDIARCTILPKEEQLELVKKYQNGDKSVLNKLIESNLKFVIYLAKNYRTTHLDIMDLIQEGNMAIKRAIETYDEEKSSLSNHMAYHIRGAIQRAIQNVEIEIRYPVHIWGAIVKYRKIVTTCQLNNNPIPSDEELCSILKLSKEQLNEMKKMEKLRITSYDVEIDMSSSYESISDEPLLKNLLPDKANTEDNFVQQITEKALGAKLKRVLTPYQYFVFYHRYLSDTKISLRALADFFGVKFQAISQAEKKALQTARRFLNNSSELQPLENEMPINPEEVVKFEFLKPYLTYDEQLLYYTIYIENKNGTAKQISKLLGWTPTKVLALAKSIKVKKEKIYQNSDEYQVFRNELLLERKTKIFDVKIQKYLS